MNILRYKIAAMVLSFFVCTGIFAQEKKGKTEVPADGERETVARKSRRADSSRHETRVYVKKYRADSANRENQVRIEKRRTDAVNAKRVTMLRMYKRDSSERSRPAKNIRSKKILVSLPCKPGATVFLQNLMHKVNIITTDDNKVMLVTTVLYQGQSVLTDSEWFSKLKLNLSGNENELQVISEEVAINTATDGRKLDSIFNGVPVFDSLGNLIGARSEDRGFLLYLPKGAKVDIESKYADITFENNAGKVKAKITNGMLRLVDADELFSTSTYSRISAGRIGQAEVEVNNGRFNAKKIDTLRISSKNSMVAVKKIALLHIKNSQADEYTIEEALHISGKKAFGTFRLTTLSGSVDLSGNNADVKIKHINPSASSVIINTQYARLALPTANLKNYTVAFEGNGGTIQAPFEKTAVANASFKASVGNKAEKPTVFRLSCQKCSVDFN